ACREQDVYVVGGGNSAGQAAMYLSQFARKVRILVRSVDLKASMSQYLIDQIDSTENIDVWGHSEVREASGNGKLQQLCIYNSDTKATEQVDAAALFIFIGAKPFTEWLGDSILA